MDGRPYLAMEFVRGRTLAESRPLFPEAVRAIRDAALAVQHAHGKGVVHRDLKPQNLMLDDRGHLWVLDFGIARPRQDATTLTRTGVALGTPAYMAPEQAGGEECTERSDVYSLGATLYYLLGGQAPFEGRTVLEVLTRVTDSDPTPRSGSPQGALANARTIRSSWSFGPARTSRRAWSGTRTSTSRSRRRTWRG